MPNLVNGLGGPAGFGEGVLGRNDDNSTGAIDIRSIFGPSGVNFFGTQYTSLFVNNNGNLTFGNPTYQYTPQPIGANLGFPIIAALWTDIDTRFAPPLMGPGAQLSPGGTSTGTNLVYYDVDPITHTFTATWDDVDFYSVQQGHPAAFQIQLIQVGEGDFDIVFNYENVQVDGRNYVNTSRAGYSPGQGQAGGFEIATSGTAQMQSIDTIPGNTGVNGYYIFHVIGGQVFGGGQGGGGGQVPDVVHPVTFGLAGLEPHREGDEGVTPYVALITRSGADLSSGSTVHWEIQTQDLTDLVAGQPLSGDVSFAPGQTVASVDIGVQGDHIFEGDDWFQFLVTSVTHGDTTWDPGLIGTAIIRNDDSPVAFSGPVMRPEGATGASPFEFMVVRTGDAAAQITLTWNLELNGSANSQDLSPGQALTGSLTLAPGATEGLITINVNGDVLPELDETFTLRLTQAVSNGATTVLDVFTTATILDDDVRATLLVSSPSSTVLPEGDIGQTAFNFNIMRVGDLTVAAQIPYTISLPTVGGTSFAEIQTPVTGFVDFAVGATQATLTVLIAADTTAEDNESFIVTLGGGQGFNTLVVNGLVLNDDKFAASVAAPATSAAAFLDADVSSFISHLTGGSSLWTDGGMI